MKNIIPNNILNIQKYLISWFLNEDVAKEYKWILKPTMFWYYEKLFDYLSKNWNELNPDLLELISGKEYIELMNLYSYNFILNKDKYILELFDWYTKTSFIDWKNVLWNLSNIKIIRNKLEEIRTWNENKSNSVKKLLYEAQEEIERAMQRWDEIIWYKTWLQTLDKYTEWLQKWTVMRLNWYSNVWKSKLSYYICNKVLKQWAKVCFFSLEVVKVKVLLNLLANWYKKDYYTIAKWKELIDFSDYYENNIDIIDNLYDIKDIIRYVEIKKPDVVFIDFLQNLKWTWNSEYERLSNIAVDIQQMAITNNIAVFDLSQVANEWLDYKRGWIIHSKGSWWLVASADVWLIIRKKDWKYLLNIAKNKFWQNDIEIDLNIDFSKWIFTDLWESSFTNNL
jgi:hypothetical protein